MPAMRRTRPVLALLALACLLPACSSMYYSTMGKFGVDKREILVDRVQDGREDQQAAKEQFQDALAAFKAATGFQGGKLEDTYDSLSRELDRCEDRAGAVTSRIRSIEDVADHLFSEWKAEIGTYDSADLRAKSEQMLADTQQRYAGLLVAMKKAEKSMQPVLKAFRDQVLFLKHNLNAQAIASLQGNVTEIEGDIAKLVKDMEASIAEADDFIATLG